MKKFFIFILFTFFYISIFACKNVIILINQCPEGFGPENQDAVAIALKKAIAQKVAPIITSIDLLKKSFNEEAEIKKGLSFFGIYVLKSGVDNGRAYGELFLIVPDKNKKPGEYGFKDNIFYSRAKLLDHPKDPNKFLIDSSEVSQITSYRDQSGNDYSENFLDGLKIFDEADPDKVEVQNEWNIYMTGHGNVVLVAGLEIDKFKAFIKYLTQCNIFFLFYDTCFGGGVNLIEAFNDNGQQMTLPFTVAQGALTGTSMKCYLDISKDFKGFFDELHKLNEEFKKKKKPGERIEVVGDFGAAIRFVMKDVFSSDYSISNNFPLIRFKHTEYFLPVYSPGKGSSYDRFSRDFYKRRGIFVVSEVMARGGQKIFEFFDETILLWYPPIFNKTISFLGYNFPKIVSMNPESFIIVIDNLKAETANFASIITGLEGVGERRKKIFFIKRLTCVDYKLKNAFFFYIESHAKFVFVQKEDENKFFEYKFPKECGIRGGVGELVESNENVRDKILGYLKAYSKYKPEFVRKSILHKEIPGVAPVKEKTELVASWQQKPAVLAAYVAYCLLDGKNKARANVLMHTRQIRTLNNLLGYQFLNTETIDDFVELFRKKEIVLIKSQLEMALKFLKLKLIALARSLSGEN
jgi:hypothetical protein